MSNQIDRVFTTIRFDVGYEALIKEHNKRALSRLDTVVTRLMNRESVQSYKPHLLNTAKSRRIYELHVDDDVLLLYAYEDQLISLDLILRGLTDHDHLQRELNKPLRISNVINVTDTTTAADVLRAASESYERRHNTMIGNIPQYIKELLDDISEETRVISEQDIEKFDSKLAQSDKYSKYAISGICGLEDRWYDAVLFDDDSEMETVASLVKDYMLYPISKTVNDSR